MKNQEFIELLNLYVDHEISTEQASLLEAEVMRNPERRKTYDQYCRMQKACRLLASSTSASAPDPEPVQVSFFPVPAWSRRLYAGGLVAAAACIVLTLALRHGPGEPTAAALRPAAVEPLGIAQSPPLQPAVNLKPVFAARPEALFADSERTPRLDWISQVRIAPVQSPQADDLVFADIPADLRLVNRPIQNPEGILAPVEMTAFQITK